MKIFPFTVVTTGMMCGILTSPSSAQVAAAPARSVASIVSIEPPAGHGVRVQRAGMTNWMVASTELGLQTGDAIETGTNSRVVLRFAEVETISLAPGVYLRIGASPGRKRGVTLLRGLLHFFHRGPPDEFETRSRAVGAIIRGTEFQFEAAEDGTATLTLFDGEVSITNQYGALELRGGEAARVAPDQAPVRSAFVEAKHLLQWRLYYPGVLDVAELRLRVEEKEALRESLTAYRSGDLLGALAKYPANREAVSDEEKIYLAAVLLSVGRVAEVDALFNASNRSPERDDHRALLVSALRRVIAAVQGSASGNTERATPSTSATAWLAESYHQQALLHLEEARAAARQATELAPNFSFAWSRLAELEFGFGRLAAAERAIERSLQLAPRNAQAVSLKGFLSAARNRIWEAVAWFDRALQIDPALGNAWLGRGLCRIRQGYAHEGRNDLQVAATVEPQRALLRSYLGKAFNEAGDDRHALHELDLAKALDPQDPTAWLYSALLNQSLNRINDGVRDLEHSIELNDQRAFYRSRLQLDQDRAVRSASLATIYQKAGLTDVSVREAARAVTADYGNSSAHLFLANSYDALRDPTRFNLRYETVWFNELLLANLLAPVGAATLSQNISQQEYSRLFDSKRLGLTSVTETRSDGQYREMASQYGSVGNLSWSLDLDYQHNDGVRPNNELDRLEWYSQLKHQLTPQDSLFLLTKYQDYHAGDNFQYYDPGNARRSFSFDEFQKPIVVGAYHREWAPGMHTLLLGGRLINDQRLRDQDVPIFVLSTNVSGQLLARPSTFDVRYQSEFEGYTAEWNQVMQRDPHTAVLGVRGQSGTFETVDSLQNTSPASNAFSVVNQQIEDGFARLALYGYYTVEPVDNLWLTGGLVYDQVTYPQNHRQVPIADGELTRDQLGPKAALVWSPTRAVTVRSAYTRSLGGVSLDGSYRLEPTQLAGFSQSFRTLLSESVAGSVSAPEIETLGAAFDLTLSSRTYLTLQGQLLDQDVDRSIGVYAFDNVTPATPAVTPQKLRYEERAASVTVNQLVSDAWAFGAQYRFAHAQLHTLFPALPVSGNPFADRTERADLHTLSFYGLFNHPSGFFARAESNWYCQHNAGYNPPLPGDSFVQVNAVVGYRFPRRFGELSLGVLNLTDDDYHLNPLNVHPELPRERVFMVRLKLSL